MIFFSNKARPYHLGPYPLERIRRDPSILEQEISAPKSPMPPDANPIEGGFGEAVEKYHQIFHGLRDNQPVAAKAPVPDDLQRRMIDIKGSGYFLNASQMAICEFADSCWLEDSTPLNHTHAIVVLVEYPRTPENGSLANSWVEGVIEETAEFRAYEIAISIANHILQMGYAATAHDSRHGAVDLARLTVMSGLGGSHRYRNRESLC